MIGALISIGAVSVAAPTASYDDAVKCYGIAFSAAASSRNVDTGGSHSIWYRRAKSIGVSNGMTSEEVASDLGRVAGSGVVSLPYPEDSSDLEAAKQFAEDARKCNDLGRTFATREEASK